MPLTPAVGQRILSASSISSAATSPSTVPPIAARATPTDSNGYLRRSRSRRLGGFLAYTLSRSTRSVSRLEGPSSIDRTHVVNAAMACDLGRRWRIGERIAAYSGIPCEVAHPRAARSPPRTPWFFRLDWRLEKRWPLTQSGGFWALVAEVLNTTLAMETLDQSCYAYGCQAEAFGPVTIPSLGVEASF